MEEKKTVSELKRHMRGSIESHHAKIIEALSA